jgi:hypothetical protein
MMNKKQETKRLSILGPIITLGMFVFANRIITIDAEKSNWKKYDRMKKLTIAIDNGKFDDDDMNWKKSKNSEIYADVDYFEERRLLRWVTGSV